MNAAEAAIEKRLREATIIRAAIASPTPSWPGAGGHTDGVSTIDRIADTFSWLGWLGSDDADLVQARLEGARWKTICFRFGISRPTAYRRWRHALALIAWRLNGRELPANCSRRRFMQLAACSM
jgi:hypothetical protein